MLRAIRSQLRDENHTPANQAYLRSLPDRLGGLPIVVEFRNREWIEDDVFELLRERDLGFCAVDQPRFKNLIPPIAEVTSECVAYVRFHGRNYETWWQHDEAYERYDYSYSAEELAEWVPKIKQMDARAKKLFAFANNHYRGQSADTAKQLRGLLDEAGVATAS